MIAGEVMSFQAGKEEPEVDCAALIEVTDWGEYPFLELTADIGKRRVHFRFRMADLVRELDEAKQA